MGNLATRFVCVSGPPCVGVTHSGCTDDDDDDDNDEYDEDEGMDDVWV